MRNVITRTTVISYYKPQKLHMNYVCTTTTLTLPITQVKTLLTNDQHPRAGIFCWCSFTAHTLLLTATAHSRCRQDARVLLSGVTYTDCVHKSFTVPLTNLLLPLLTWTYWWYCPTETFHWILVQTASAKVAQQESVIILIKNRWGQVDDFLDGGHTLLPFSALTLLLGCLKVV